MKIKKEVGYYQVKELLDLKKQFDKEYCLVWWNNYPKNQATWQPIDNLKMLSDWDICYEELKDRKKATKQDNHSNYQSSNQAEGKSKNHFKQIKTRKKNQKNIDDQYLLDILQRKELDNNVIRQHRQYKKPRSKQHTELRLASQNVSFGQSSQQIEEYSKSQASSQKIEIKRKEKIKRPTKKIEKKDVKVVKYRGQKMELKPLSIDLQVTQSKNIPFEGLELQRIKNSFMKEDKILYEVQFKDDPIKEAIIINKEYLKLLWPRKYAEFLLGKICNNNGKT